ncbi:YciI family protein [Humibacter sp. RRB41]|uniref:YciI family protein n=1 Tax=Humibacter sp. RRB41 TaxID=2919946 RepID=UPI001FA9D9A8|nr:YciI family protein [Humibacter sp. RRB41]
MQFLVCVIDNGQAVAAGRSESATAAEMAAIDVYNERLIADGNWVFAGGLGAPDAATVIDNRDNAGEFTDGPYVESTEFVAGFWIIEAADHDAALKLAAEGSKACNRKVEVRQVL